MTDVSSRLARRVGRIITSRANYFLTKQLSSFSPVELNSSPESPLEIDEVNDEFRPIITS